MTYTGRISVRSFRVDRVHPGRFKTWAECRAYFNRFASDRKTVFVYGSRMSEGDTVEPIRLAVARDSGTAFVDDGQHRVLAALDVRLVWLPYHWVWLGSGAVQRQPLPFEVLEKINDH